MRRRHHSCFEVKYLTVSLPSYRCCFVPRGIEISGLLKVGRKMAWSFYSHSVHFSALQRKLRENKMNSSFTLYELKYVHIKFVLLSWKGHEQESSKNVLQNIKLSNNRILPKKVFALVLQHSIPRQQIGGNPNPSCSEPNGPQSQVPTVTSIQDCLKQKN